LGSPLGQFLSAPAYASSALLVPPSTTLGPSNKTILEFLKKSESDSGFHRAIRDDLERAREVHKAFSPDPELSIPGLVCESFYKPVHSIGGDYYDFLPLKDECWGMAIGDVCGKGIGAALLMASLQASLRAQAMHAHSNLSNLIDGVERLILAASPKHLYASLFYSEYDPGNDEADLTSAIRRRSAKDGSHALLARHGERAFPKAAADLGYLQ
jgi:Stage II sporulation protein E (SpoIIE)